MHRLWLGRAEKELGGEQHFCLIWKRGMLLLILCLRDASSALFSSRLYSSPYAVKRKENTPTKKNNLEHSGYQWESILHSIAILYKKIYEADTSEISELDKISGKKMLQEGAINILHFQCNCCDLQMLKAWPITCG